MGDTSDHVGKLWISGKVEGETEWKGHKHQWYCVKKCIARSHDCQY